VPLTIVLIAGIGRSGSTLFERLLVERPGIAGVGELANLWDRGFGADELCSCGERFSRCALWRPIAEGLASDDATADLVASYRHYGVERLRHALPYARNRGISPMAAGVAAAYDRTYEAVAAATGAQVIVDSSKEPGHVALVSASSCHRVRVVQLTRDLRGVVCSFARRRQRPEAHDGSFMHTAGAPRVTADWVVQNMAAEHLARRFGGMHLRYEDLVDDPRRAVDRVLEEFDLAPGACGEGRGAVGWHSVSGNPLRLATRHAPVQLDDEWASMQWGRSARLSFALAKPWRSRYGYR
jgi:hypothetical protein